MESTDHDSATAMADVEPPIEAELIVEELEERSVLAVHGVCACTCTCSCTSTSCIAWAA